MSARAFLLACGSQSGGTTPHGHTLMAGDTDAARLWNAGSMKLEREQVDCERAQPCRNRGGAAACPCDGDGRAA